MSLKNEVGHPLFTVKARTCADGEDYNQIYVLAADSFTELGEILDEWFDFEEVVSFDVSIFENVEALDSLVEAMNG